MKGASEYNFEFAEVSLALWQRFVEGEAFSLADAYIQRGILGPGSRSDALHVALATVGGVDVLVSWNFRHIVNLGRVRLFHSANLERGYPLIEIRSPLEVLDYE